MNKGSLARKVALAFIVSLTALAGLAPLAPGAGAAANYDQVRYDGTDRFDTAALIAGAIAEATPTAVLARADIYPDALTGAYAAANNSDAPLLLTRSDSVPARTMAALEAEGVQDVVLLGGPQAIWESVETQLEGAGYNVRRLFGATRYQTAIEIAEDAGTASVGSIDGDRAALLSSGENFPDALSGAPLSFASFLPSYLTPADLDGGDAETAIFDQVVGSMNGLNIDHVYILGGPVAVSEDIETALVTEGFDVTRLFGGDRHATSVEIFNFGLEKSIYTNRRFGVARSETFPDALAYAPLAGRPRNSPAPNSGVADTGGASNGLLLTPNCSLATEVEDFLLEHQATWTQGEILGGDEAICDEIAADIAELASTGRVDIDVNNTQVNAGGTITGRITGSNIASVTVSGCGFTNQAVTRDAEGDFSLTLPASQTTDCTLTFTTTFTDGGTETDQVPIDVVAPGDPDVTLNPTGGTSGSQTTATYSGNRPAEITDVSSPNCAISGEGTQTNNRTFTVSGEEGTDCTIVTTVTFTDTQGGTGTFQDTYTITSTPTGGAAASVRPELVSASLGTTSATTGTPVTYCFDEEVTGATAPVAGLFHVYTFDGDTQHNGSGTPVITAENNNCVRVNIATITTTANRDRLSVATVDFGAVTDNEGSENPIGDAALGTGQETTLSAGVTSAPDLLSVTACAPEPSGGDTDGIPETRCTFTFDERAFTVNPAGFHLVLASGDPINCVAIAGVEGGMPTDRPTADADTTIVAECQQTAASGPIATAAVARGYVDPNTVSDDPDDQATRANNNQAAGNFTATEGCDVAQDDLPVPGAACEGNLNPLQATDTPDESTPDPDLVSATLEHSDGTRDRIIYDFDETVQATGLDAADFCFYNSAGDQFCGTGTQEPITRGADDSTVVVTFPNGALGQAVGASVLDGAVLDVNSRPNEEDEEGMANANQSIISAGRTDNPDLTSVAIQTVTDTSSTTFQATYAFDEDIDISTLAASEADNAAPGTVGDFFLIAADGTRYVATACTTRTTGDTPAGTEDTDHTVRCTQYSIANAAGGSTGVVPTNTALMAAVVGTVDDGAVNEEGAGTGTNPEGAERTSGGTGSPAA